MKFLNIVELYHKVLPFEWNSFCISLSTEKVVIYHNGQVQGMQNMTIKDAGRYLKPMTMGHIGGAKFIGILSDLQIHSREMSGEELIKWTKCQNQERIINTLSLKYFNSNLAFKSKHNSCRFFPSCQKKVVSRTYIILITISMF